jgi:hypothetical protein
MTDFEWANCGAVLVGLFRGGRAQHVQERARTLGVLFCATAVRLQSCQNDGQNCCFEGQQL